MNTAKLLNFNAYYNRQYKALPEDYTDLTIYTAANINFNPNDGINTSHVFNIASVDESLVNYCLILDENGAIVSRWFVIDLTRTRLNQFEVTLRRDLLAEYFDEIIGAPTFIEKAIVNYGNPLLFNSEDMTFNQIKTSELAIRDNSLCPWIVGYIKSDTEAQSFDAPTSYKYFSEYAALEDIPFYDQVIAGSFSGNATIDNLAIDYRWGVSEPLPIFNKINHVKFNANGNITVSTSNKSITEDYYTGIVSTLDEDDYTQERAGKVSGQEFSTYYTTNKSAFDLDINNEFSLTDTSSTAAFLNTYSEKGTVIKVGNVIYKISRSAGVPRKTKANPKNNSTSALYNRFTNLINASPSVRFLYTPVDVRLFEVEYSVTDYSINVEVLSGADMYHLDMPSPSARKHLSDAPYDMFAIPYNYNSKLEAGTSFGSLDIENCNADAAMAIVSTMAQKLASNLIDLQLLPYCPIPELCATSSGTILFPDEYYTNGIDYSFIYYTNAEHTDIPVSAVFWCTNSLFSITVDKEFKYFDRYLIASPIKERYEITEPKVQALCDIYRLVSPNYNGQFEFNVVKNGGLTYFKVDCSYKPFTPYIRVAPNFGNMYGGEFDDARGLICGGDFSLPTTSDAWQEYQINNKNYLNAFNRQIENMEVTNKYQRINEMANVAAGTVGSAIGGVAAGGVVGGPIGAAVGGATAATLSVAGGIADYHINEKLRAEALDYTKDQFGYQLGNIRALPYSLNRVSAFNINNKIFPILEYYTCTDIEKEALRNKIKYNGMTVMTIGTIADYLQEEPSYIKGKLIRLEGFDNHTVTEIANELNKGFYI